MMECDIELWKDREWENKINRTGEHHEAQPRSLQFDTREVNMTLITALYKLASLSIG